MGKKSRKKSRTHPKRRVIPPAFPLSGLEYVEMSPPFDGISDEEITSQIKNIGDKFTSLFEVSFLELQEKILSVNPISLLSSLSFYGLTTTEGVRREWKEIAPILQHHVEIIQALALIYQSEEFSSNPALPSNVQEIIDLCQKTTTAFHMRRLAKLEQSMPFEKRQRLHTLEDMRIQTQSIRNWGYPQQITSIVKKLFEPIDNDIEQHTGVRISHLIDMCLNIVDTTESRLNSHIKLLRPVFKSRDIDSAIDKYYTSFPDINADKEELDELLNERKSDINEVKYLLLSHSDLRLPDIYSFTFDDFLSRYPGPIEPDKLLSILTNWSLSFGDTADKNAEYFFMGNPIWKQPIIFFNDNNFFWPIVGLFFSFCLEIMESIIESNPRLNSKYEERRGKFLELEIEELFKSAFPSAKIYRGSIWHDHLTNKDYENDLLVLIDSFLIIIEAKSGKIAHSAHRGGELSLQRAIDELLIEPSIQNKRFSEFIRENPGTHRFQTKHGEVNEISTSNIFVIASLNITLELLPFLKEGWPNLRQAGFIPHEIDVTPTMSLSELEIVLHILERPSEKLHYLVRRTQFEKNAKYNGDELDLLAFYLDTGFNIGEAEFNKMSINLWGMSQLFDQYYLTNKSYNHALKPQRRLTELWKDILTNLEEKKTFRWTEISYILLNVSYEDQLHFEIDYNIVKKNVRKNWWKPDKKDSIICFNGPPQRQDILVGFAYKKITRDKRNEMMKNMAIEAMEEKHSNRALVIGYDIELKHYPYSVIGCVVKGDKESNIIF